MSDHSEDRVLRGRVLELGPPAYLSDDPGSPTMPWDCEIGDEVLFEPVVWLDKMRSFEMAGVQGTVWVVAQIEILGVVA